MVNRFQARADGSFRFADAAVRCALGKGGVVSAEAKREGDGASPAGLWPIRRVFYRPDRIDGLTTVLPVSTLRPSDGWCDAPDDPAYNRPVILPYPASHEGLWREDQVYDVIVELGYNDDPIVPGKGSAIFLHVARDNYAPTEGCVALALDDVRALLAIAQPGDAIEITL
jgi:L,D-peptidoglycan transpeptidase YkuD (ErfK/YbiS/YcfS/YnhG family)